MKFLKIIPTGDGIVDGTFFMDSEDGLLTVIDNQPDSRGRRWYRKVLDYAEGYTRMAKAGPYNCWLKKDVLWVGCSKLNVNNLPTENNGEYCTKHGSLVSSSVQPLLEQIRIFKIWGILPYKGRVIDKNVLITVTKTKKGYSFTQNKKVVATGKTLPIQITNFWTWKGKSVISGFWNEN